MSKHLDLGCGSKPRNPLNKKHLYGVDIVNPKNITNKSFIYKKKNLIKYSIPFNDNTFDSVSAFDFIEHIPRVWIKNNGQIDFTFIRLMNEIYRILKPDGIFISSTPVYPFDQIFEDPTHVNFITQNTVKYFCGEKPLGRMYGFRGSFKILENKLIPGRLFDKQFKTKFQKLLYIFKKTLKRERTHVLWKLQANKHKVKKNILGK